MHKFYKYQFLLFNLDVFLIIKYFFSLTMQLDGRYVVAMK